MPDVGMNGGLVGGRYDGMNEQGLFVALHKVMADRPLHLPPGVPFHLLPRLALETCATAHDAARLLVAMPHLAAFNYTIADASGACLAVETYPGRQAQVRVGEQGIAVANHAESAALAPLQGQRSLVSSHARSAAMAQIPPPWDDAWDAATALLADHRWGHVLPPRVRRDALVGGLRPERPPRRLRLWPAMPGVVSRDRGAVGRVSG